MRFALALLVVTHFAVVLGNVAFAFVLPFAEPPWVALPLCSFVLWVTFNRDTCPLTRLENSIRKRIGMKPIGGFVGHYVVKPLRGPRPEPQLAA